MPQLTIRPLMPDETDLFLSYAFPRVPELWETRRDYAGLLAKRQYRPEHSWVALEDGVVVGRAAWWTGQEDTHPAALDWLEAMPGPRQVEIGSAILAVAHETMRNEDGRRPDYHLFMQPGWRDVPHLREAGEARLCRCSKWWPHAVRRAVHLSLVGGKVWPASARREAQLPRGQRRRDRCDAAARP